MHIYNMFGFRLMFGSSGLFADGPQLAQFGT